LTADYDKLAYEETAVMSFKENLHAKIRLDRLYQSLVSTTREPPGRRWLDKELTKELLAMTDFEHLVLFNEENQSLGLKKGAFSPQSDSDLGWVMQYARGEQTADLQDIHVFEFLAELAAVKAHAQRA